jgi:GYF domain 2
LKQFSYSRDGQDFGPTDLGGLRQLARSMHLRPECMVREQGRPEAVQASAIKGLRFTDPEIQADDGRIRPVLMDLVYLAEQRRLILSVLLGGAAFLATLFVVTLLLGSMI